MNPPRRADDNQTLLSICFTLLLHVRTRMACAGCVLPSARQGRSVGCDHCACRCSAAAAAVAADCHEPDWPRSDRTARGEQTEGRQETTAESKAGEAQERRQWLLVPVRGVRWLSVVCCCLDLALTESRWDCWLVPLCCSLCSLYNHVRLGCLHRCSVGRQVGHDRRRHLWTGCVNTPPPPIAASAALLVWARARCCRPATSMQIARTQRNERKRVKLPLLATIARRMLLAWMCWFADVRSVGVSCLCLFVGDAPALWASSSASFIKPEEVTALHKGIKNQSDFDNMSGTGQ